MIETIKSWFKPKDKVVVIGTAIIEIETLKEVDIHITSINVDVYLGRVGIIYETGTSVNKIFLSIEEAERIGFINRYAILKYLK